MKFATNFYRYRTYFIGVGVDGFDPCVGVCLPVLRLIIVHLLATGRFEQVHLPKERQGCNVFQEESRC